MKKITRVLAAILIFTGCAEKQPDFDSTLSTKDSLSANTIVTDQQPQVVKTDSTLSQPAIVAPLDPAIVKNATNVVAAGMNPAHGQPNHRCDIAVGAPLNSPVVKPASPAVTTTQAITPTTAPANASSAKTVTAPGMNPPHGEPNHRCDIAVGAPLNSPVTKPAAPQVTPVKVPAAKDSGS